MWYWVRPILPLVASLRLTPRGKLKQSLITFGQDVFEISY